MAGVSTILEMLKSNNITRIDSIGNNITDRIKPIVERISKDISSRTYKNEKVILDNVNAKARESFDSLEKRSALEIPKTPDGLIPKASSFIKDVLLGKKGLDIGPKKEDLKALEVVTTFEVELNKARNNLEKDYEGIKEFKKEVTKAINGLQNIITNINEVISTTPKEYADKRTWVALNEKNHEVSTQIAVYKTVLQTIDIQLDQNSDLQRTMKKSINQTIVMWRSVIANQLSGSSLLAISKSAQQTNEALTYFLEKSVDQQQRLVEASKELEQSKQEVTNNLHSFYQELTALKNEVDSFYEQSDLIRQNQTKILQNQFNLVEKAVDAEFVVLEDAPTPLSKEA